MRDLAADRSAVLAIAGDIEDRAALALQFERFRKKRSLPA
jgi:hypothetical protein